MSGSWDSPAELFIRFPVPCIEPVITSHLEMLFRDMLDEKGNEIHYRNSFFHIRIIFVFIVMESHIFPIVRIDAGSGNDGTSKVAADIFNDGIRITEIGFGIDIEAVFIFFVNVSFGLFKRRTDMGFKFVQESGLKGFAEIGIVEMFNGSPEAVIREPAFGKETVNVWIPFQGSAESVEDADKTGNKVSAFIEIMEESEDDTADSLKKAVKEGAVIEEERAQVFINGKNEVPVSTINEFEGHFR